MKKIIYFILGLTLSCAVCSCDDYLDINTDPDNPTAVNASSDVRLPWIQHYYGYATGTAAMRTNTILGLLTQTSTTSAMDCWQLGILLKVVAQRYTRTFM